MPTTRKSSETFRIETRSLKDDDLCSESGDTPNNSSDRRDNAEHYPKETVASAARFARKELDYIAEMYVANYDLFHKSSQGGGRAKEAIAVKRKLLKDMADHLTALVDEKRTVMQIDQKIRDEVRQVKKYFRHKRQEMYGLGGYSREIRLSSSQQYIADNLRTKPRLAGLLDDIEGRPMEVEHLSKATSTVLLLHGKLWSTHLKYPFWLVSIGVNAFIHLKMQPGTANVAGAPVRVSIVSMNSGGKTPSSRAEMRPDTANVAVAPVRVSILSMNSGDKTSSSRAEEQNFLDADENHEELATADRICFDMCRGISIHTAADLTKPIDNRVYKGTYPTFHHPDEETAISTCCSSIIGFYTGQTQLIDPFYKEYQETRLYNEERLIDKAGVTCLHWLRGPRKHFLVSETTGYMCPYDEEHHCPVSPLIYQTFTQQT